MASLKGSKTEENLKYAFAGESQANRRYLYFAQKADVEGYNDVAAVFRSTAEGETGHAHGHLEFLESVGDPATGLPIGKTSANLVSAVAGETHEYTDMYPGMARSAREEGFEETAFIQLGAERIPGIAEADQDRTNAQGKASSVQFVHFDFTPAQIASFKAPGTQVVLGLSHPNYGHMAVLPEAVRLELAGDFD